MDVSAAELNFAEDEDFEEIDQEDNEGSEEVQENSENTSCDVCDRHFSTVFQYQKHLKEHRTCGIDGCTFTAHGKIVDKHVEMQHITGLYDKIRNISTPEDIAKWIEDRKRKYPTKDNVEKRTQQQKEMIKRGERLQENNRRFSRKKDVRFTQVRKSATNSKRQTKKVRKPTKPVSLIDEKLDWNGTLFPFKGTAEVYGEKVEDSDSDFDDSEWLEDEKINTSPVEQVKLTNALGDLMSAYNSDDDLEDVETVQTQTANENKNNSTNVEKTDNNEDDDAPLEVKINREPDQGTSANSNCDLNDQQPTSSKKKRKKLKHGTVTDKKLKGETSTTETPFMQQPFRKRKVTLLERLLDSEIRHERNVLLQCVRFVVKNDYFRKE